METIENKIQEAIENKSAQILTLENAKQLIGKKIITKYFGYRGQDGVEAFTVKEIISAWDLASRNIDAANFPQGNQQLYWNSYMAPTQILKEKNKLVIISELGNTSIYCHLDGGFFEEPTFTCSDADRVVFFIEVSE